MKLSDRICAAVLALGASIALAAPGAARAQSPAPATINDKAFGGVAVVGPNPSAAKTVAWFINNPQFLDMYQRATARGAFSGTLAEFAYRYAGTNGYLDGISGDFIQRERQLSQRSSTASSLFALRQTWMTAARNIRGVADLKGAQRESGGRGTKASSAGSEDFPK